MGALLLALGAGCGEAETIDVAPDETDPGVSRSEPPFPPDRAPEPTGCESLFLKTPDGFVMPIPVECQFELIDRGDPPNESPVQKEKEMFENPADQIHEV